MNKHANEEEKRTNNIAEMISEKVWKEDFPLEMQRTLRLIGQHDLVGALMKKAIEEGEFDNLEGTGKPLDLDGNPFEQTELHMGNKILKNAGYVPYWIELNEEINALRAKLDQEVEYYRKYTLIVLSEKRSAMAISRYEEKKKNFYAESRERLAEISKKILDYNLYCPVSTLGRSNFDVEAELHHIIEEIESVTDELRVSQR